jgi:hypothetical protein
MSHIVIPGPQIPRFGVAAPGMPVLHTGAPSGVAHGAPIMTQGQQAGAILGCPPGINCAGGGIADAASWWSKIPLWVKIGGGFLLLGGVGYGVYRFVR